MQQMSQLGSAIGAWMLLGIFGVILMAMTTREMNRVYALACSLGSYVCMVASMVYAGIGLVGNVELPAHSLFSSGMTAFRVMMFLTGPVFTWFATHHFRAFKDELEALLNKAGRVRLIAKSDNS